MKKSSNRTPNYRPGTSRKVISLSTFRDQMSDYARAERLVALRKARHVSRERVASAIDVSTKAVYAWENGGGIRWLNAQKLGAFYGVDPESLVSRVSGEAEMPPPANTTALTQLDRVEAKLDAILEHFEITDPAEELEELLGEPDPPSQDTDDGNGEDEPDHGQTGS
jgi:transcriptional regulator with XRE-family HTH domain